MPAMKSPWLSMSTRPGSATEVSRRYGSVQELLNAENPREPVYCVFPHAYRESTRFFLDGFPGRVLFAVKANNHPSVLKILIDAGVTHFDCASLEEVALIDRVSPESTKYFMVPTRIRDAARFAQERHDCRHFVIDHPTGLELLSREVDMPRTVVFARMAVHHDAALADLSIRFGAKKEDVPGLLQAIRDSGAEPALAFNVGSSVLDPVAYRYAIEETKDVLEKLPFRLRLIDVGGGYPKSYPGFVVPHITEYFTAVGESFAELPLTDDAEVLGEPGRALASSGMSAIVEVLLRKDDRLFLNDGMFGIFWELRYKGHERFPVRAWRNGRPLDGVTRSFQLNGPTCDGTDVLPGAVELPEDIRPGDHLEFGNIGAYSLSGRTDFNGYYSDNIVIIDSEAELPPPCPD